MRYRLIGCAGCTSPGGHPVEPTRAWPPRGFGHSGHDLPSSLRDSQRPGRQPCATSRLGPAAKGAHRRTGRAQRDGSTRGQRTGSDAGPMGNVRRDPPGRPGDPAGQLLPPALVVKDRHVATSGLGMRGARPAPGRPWTSSRRPGSAAAARAEAARLWSSQRAAPATAAAARPERTPPPAP
jgi:hypothetical protein